LLNILQLAKKQRLELKISKLCTFFFFKGDFLKEIEKPVLLYMYVPGNQVPALRAKM
jgi:hypothetical protein